MTPEFSRIERLDMIGEREREITVEATASERAALADRFGVVSIGALTGHFAARREAAGIAVRGTVSTEVVQACSVTGEPLGVKVDEQVALLFVESLGDGEEEVELDGTALDTVEIEGGGIDLGEIAAETMALALDPFPRGPNALAALKEAGIKAEEEVGPFSGLAALRDQLRNG